MLTFYEVDEPMAQTIPLDSEPEQQLLACTTELVVSEPLKEVVLHGRNGQYVRGRS